MPNVMAALANIGGALCSTPIDCNVRAPIGPAQSVEIFGNVSTPFGTLAIQ